MLAAVSVVLAIVLAHPLAAFLRVPASHNAACHHIALAISFANTNLAEDVAPPE
jgi:hypothetical protein